MLLFRLISLSRGLFQQLEGLEMAIGSIAAAKIRHLDSKNTEEVARNQVTDVLTTLPNLHHIAVISINDETAAGAIDAAKAAGRLNDDYDAGQAAVYRETE